MSRSPAPASSSRGTSRSCASRCRTSSEMGSGNLIIVSGPSGAGKSALAAAVLARVPGLRFSISYTTRSPRGSEHEGLEYHFVAPERFRELVSQGEFLEWAEVYGNYY